MNSIIFQKFPKKSLWDVGNDSKAIQKAVKQFIKSKELSTCVALTLNAHKVCGLKKSFFSVMSSKKKTNTSIVYRHVTSIRNRSDIGVALFSTI